MSVWIESVLTIVMIQDKNGNQRNLIYQCGGLNMYDIKLHAQAFKRH